MHAIEIRLAGRQANLAGITRSINRHIGQQRLKRIELRYSTQASAPLAPQAAQRAISQLLRESGLGTAAVSVRAHDGPIDDATGEHLLRLFVEEPPAVAQPGQLPAGPRGWWARLLSRRAVGGPGASGDAGPPPPVANPLPSISRREAVSHLRQAVEIAARHVESSIGSQPVGEARVIVRLDRLHDVLGPLVAADAVQAAQSIGPMVRACGMATAADFKVSYRHQPRVVGDGTAFATESDVEVRLIVDVGHDPAADGTALSGGTCMPVSSRRSEVLPDAAPVAACAVRVIGTMDADFTQAFELSLKGPTARFDRHALEQAGFASRHPGLLPVASNSCPLHVRVDEHGVWWLDAGTRAGADGARLPMYFRRCDLAAVTGPTRLPADGLRLIVNAPGGVHDALSGRVLPALVIELRPHQGRGDV